MPDGARTAILGRLRAVAGPTASGRKDAVPDLLPEKYSSSSSSDRVLRLRRCMEAARTEFLEATEAAWPEKLNGFLLAEGLRRVAFPPATDAGRRLTAACPAGGDVTLVPYDRPVEEMKDALFSEIDAGFTTARGAIAETGSLVLWPSPEEPRLLSLVPPIHIALLDRRTIRDTFEDVLREERWAEGIPPNALLISGPSKTADIEQTLAYGVHGPKRLVVVLV